MKIFKIFRHSKEKWKIDPKIPPNDLKNEKFTKKIKNFEKNDFFENLQTIYKKIKNWTENSPQMTSKMKSWYQNDNFEKNGKFWKSSDNLEKIKNLPKNSPKWSQNWKIDIKNENFEKNENF